MAHPPSRSAVRPSSSPPWGVLSVALCALLASCSKPAQDAPSQLAARVNKSEISVHQVNYALSRQPGLGAPLAETAPRQALEGLIDQEMAVQQALNRKLDREPGVMQALAAARREVLARAYAESVAAAAVKPDATEVKAYFDARPALFAQRKVYALQEATVQVAGPALDALRERVRSAKVMQDVSDYLKAQKLPVRINQLTATAESLPKPLLDVLARARDGQALFLPAPGGARIIVVTGQREAPLTLAQASPAIEQLLVQQRRMQLVDTEVKALRKSTAIEYLGTFAQAAASAPPAGGSAPAAAATPVAAPRPDAATTTVDATNVDPASVRRGLGAGLK